MDCCRLAQQHINERVDMDNGTRKTLQMAKKMQEAQIAEYVRAHKYMQGIISLGLLWLPDIQFDTPNNNTVALGIDAFLLKLLQTIGKGMEELSQEQRATLHELIATEMESIPPKKRITFLPGMLKRIAPEFEQTESRILVINREVHHHHNQERQAQPATDYQTQQEKEELPIPKGKTQYSQKNWNEIFQATSGAGIRPDYYEIAKLTGKTHRTVKNEYGKWRNRKEDETTL